MGEILYMAATFILRYTKYNLALYQKSTHYMGLKVLISLPTYVKDRKHDVDELNDL
jgi:hypothetical protein